MKGIRLIKGKEFVGVVMASGFINYKIFKAIVYKTWSEFNSLDKEINLDNYILYHNSVSYVQIEAFKCEDVCHELA